MAWSEILTQLNETLARLYPDQNASRRIVDMAGLPTVKIAFRDRAVDNWHGILEEADKQNRVANVIDAALTDYLDNRELIALRASFAPPPSALHGDSRSVRSYLSR